jgi:hypothetical protein
MKNQTIKSEYESGQRANIIYIAGSGRSGSTILDVTLNQHSQIVGLGEVNRLSSDPSSRKCGCGQVINECEFWRPVIEKMCQDRNVAVNSWETAIPINVNKKKNPNRKLPDINEIVFPLNFSLLKPIVMMSKKYRTYLKAIENSLYLYDVIVSTEGKKTVVDSTKNPLRLAALHSLRPKNIFVIHLVRDGRAIIASAKRRGELDAIKNTKIWKADNTKMSIVLSRIPNERILLIKYEEFCDHPVRVLKKICQFVNLSYNDNLSNLIKPSHAIPGNPWLINNKNWPIKIKKDERWKKELTKNELKIFKKISGKINKKYGYSS